MSDNNIYLDFTVSRERTVRNDDNRIASGTRNVVKARFKMIDDWIGIAPVAIFSKGKNTFKILTVNGECDVPNEMTAQEGHFTVCVYGGDLKTTTTEKAHVAVVRSGYMRDDEIISENGEDILSFVKTLDNKIQFIREGGDGSFEYSTDGKTWLKVDSAWFPSVSKNGDLSWERKVSWEQPPTVNIKGDTGTQGPIGLTGPAGPQGNPGINIDVSSGFISMYVDENGDLWLLTAEGGENNFEFDENTGNLYYVMEVAA